MHPFFHRSASRLLAVSQTKSGYQVTNAHLVTLRKLLLILSSQGGNLLTNALLRCKRLHRETNDRISVVLRRIAACTHEHNVVSPGKRLFSDKRISTTPAVRAQYRRYDSSASTIAPSRPQSTTSGPPTSPKPTVRRPRRGCLVSRPVQDSCRSAPAGP